MTSNQKSFLRQSSFWGLAFLLPMLLLFILYAFFGIYPFGERSLLTIDLNGQYVDFYAGYRDLLLNGEGLFYSFHAGMGLNFLGLVSYYLASPFAFLTLLFPLSHLTEAILLMTLLKVGCCGLTFFAFARYKFKNGGFLSVAFAVCYALCSYNIVYASNLMWLDGVLFLPLVLLGAEKIINEKKYLLFIISLIFLFVSNYYISIMAGVFSFLYFICSGLSQLSVREFIKRAVGFGIGTLLAVGCAAFLLLPAYFALKNGQFAMGGELPVFSTNFSLLEFLTRFTNGAYDTLVTEGCPNIYPSMLAVCTFPLYFFCRKIPVRERLLFLGLTVLLILSMVLTPLDFMWHGFKFPTWFPYRYSFVFSFLLVFLAYRALISLQEFSLRVLWAVFAVETVLFLTLSFLATDSKRQILLSVGLLILFAAQLLLWHFYGSYHRAFAVILLVVVCADLSLNANTLLSRIDDEFSYQDRESYVDFVEKYRPIFEAYLPGENQFYRMEGTHKRSDNDPLTLNYPGISHYSTTSNQRLNWFLRDLGFRYGTQNSIVYARSPIITNSFLGIRYVVSEESLQDEGYQLVDGENGVYENPYAFPLAFAAPQNQPQEEPLAPNDYSAHPNIYEQQNGFLNTLAGTQDKDYFVPLKTSEPVYTNVIASSTNYNLIFSKLSATEKGYFEITIQNPDRVSVYASMPVFSYRYSSAKLYVNGKYLKNHFSYMNSQAVYLGNEPVITLRVELSDSTLTVDTLAFYGVDLDLLSEMSSQIQQNALSFTEFSQSQFTGTVTVEENECLVTTLPYDEGWRAYVDGQEVEIKRYLGVFSQIDLSPGEHEVEFRFVPYGFVTGSIVSVFSVILLIALGVGRRTFQRKNRKAH